MDLHAEFDGLDLRLLRTRPGAKWQVPAADVLPAWVADMDFRVAEPVRTALRDMIDVADLGYPDWPDNVSPLRQAYCERMAKRHGWLPNAEHVREFTDVTQAVQAVLHLATRLGDGVAVHTPAFGPITRSIAAMDRRLVPIPMIDTDGGWRFDLDRFAHAVRTSGCRMLLLVNPHNPTGRVFTREELCGLAEVADRYDMVVVSDEIHADLVYAPHEHIPFASLGPDVEARTVTVYSASKAFNLAGMRCAAGHIGPAALRAAFAALPGSLFGSINVLAVRASLAAWTDGDGWLAATLDYLDRNRTLVADVLAERLPDVRHHLPEAGFLSWIDCRALGWGDDPAATFRDLAGVELSPGPSFNPGGDGFVRLNFATSSPLLRQILDRLVDSTARLGR
jgi:cysteine-S-conjugate beta-lyase